MGRWYHRKLWHPDYEILPPLRAERDHSQIARTQKTITTAYKVLSRPDDFTRPYSRGRYGMKSVAAAAASLRATRAAAQEDERHFHPAKKFRSTKTTTGRSATISPVLKAKIFRPGDRGFRSSKRKNSPLAQARRVFNFPSTVIPCIQRKVRREVIMALTGGGASHAKKRLTKNSNIGC